MKLHQLRYICEVARRELSVSEAALNLHTSQSGISKQIQLLEEELKLQIFHRKGKRLTGITEPGKIIVDLAKRMLQEMDSIRQVGEEFSQESGGTLTIATTHTQARYRLPPVVKTFMQRFPNVKLNIHQGHPAQVVDQVVNGEADIGIATEAVSASDQLASLPCYQWNRCLIAPPMHPIFNRSPLTLADISQYPLITYDFAFTGASLVNQVFAGEGLMPNVVLTAIDADVIKTYVSLGLGIGLLAAMAYEQERDANLGMIDVSHLFPPSTTYLGIRRGAYLRGFVYGFIRLFAPQFDRHAVDLALHSA